MEKEPFDIEAAVRDLQAMGRRHDDRFGEVDARFAQVDARFAQVDARFAQVDARFDRLEARLDRHDDLLTTMVRMMTQLERTQGEHSRRFEQLDAKIDLRFEQIQSDFRAFKEVLLDHSQRIGRLEDKVFSNP